MTAMEKAFEKQLGIPTQRARGCEGWLRRSSDGRSTRAKREVSGLEKGKVRSLKLESLECASMDTNRRKERQIQKEVEKKIRPDLSSWDGHGRNSYHLETRPSSGLKDTFKKPPTLLEATDAFENAHLYTISHEFPSIRRRRSRKRARVRIAPLTEPTPKHPTMDISSSRRNKRGAGWGQNGKGKAKRKDSRKGKEGEGVTEPHPREEGKKGEKARAPNTVAALPLHSGTWTTTAGIPEATTT
ncbi:hypothetical protein L211DRAFT_853547 [Terfezia boudieri ATCC MYA-4762]|uniref:Uncharacterized protein n=1 Tax=Terfezia boudieri ATCC MYA-4762 TaxID=1051890 RepID=A0A3N4LBD4_9PEZI|nr:hypothetical protein L211DRAFT_853547 [Terfezia boudieri ATCC MYA-4762]